MKKINKLIVVFTLICLQVLFVSCSKDEEISNKLVSTEWSDSKGVWLFSFQDNTTLNIIYKIPKSPHAYNFDGLSYELNGDNLTITDYKFDYKNEKFYLIKEFKGTVKDDNITCSFKTPTTQVEQGHYMPDFNKLVTSNVVLLKK